MQRPVFSTCFTLRLGSFAPSRTLVLCLPRHLLRLLLLPFSPLPSFLPSAPELSREASGTVPAPSPCIVPRVISCAAAVAATPNAISARAARHACIRSEFKITRLHGSWNITVRRPRPCTQVTP